MPLSRSPVSVIPAEAGIQVGFGGICESVGPCLNCHSGRSEATEESQGGGH